MVSKKERAMKRKKKKQEQLEAAKKKSNDDEASDKADKETKVEVEPEEQPPVPPKPPPPPLSSFFKMRQMPWWLVFIIGIYLIIKLQGVYESPCAVLGLQSPVSRRDATKAYRKASICTHPDKLINAGKVDKQRGHILFTRATEAREAIVEALKKSKAKKISCFGHGGPFATEAWAVQLLYELFFTSEGWKAMPIIGREIGTFFYGLVTLEAGFLTSFGVTLVLYQIFGYLYRCCSLMSEGGPVRLVLRLATMMIFGPLPTATHFFIAPLVRWKVFVSKKLMNKQPAAEAPDDVAEGGEPEAAPTTADKVLSSATDISSKAKVVGGVRRRKKEKKVTARDEEEQEKYSLVGKLASGKMAPDLHAKIAEDGAARANQQLSGDYPEGSDDDEEGGEEEKKKVNPKDPVSIFQFLRSVLLLDTLVRLVSIDRFRRPGWRKNKLNGLRILQDPLQPENFVPYGRVTATRAIQFTFLVTMTKPIIPLVMVIVTGQVMNPFLSSMAVSYILRSHVPKLSSDSIHVMLLCFGFLHTVLGASTAQIRHGAEVNPNMIKLEWHWGIKDAMMIANIVSIGTLFSNIAYLGNEPMMITTFGAGVALRMLWHDVSPYVINLGISDMLFGRGKMLDVPVTFSTLAEAATHCKPGIGDCTGGPFRMFFGENAAVAVTVAKMILIVLPLLSMVMWGKKTVEAFHKYSKSNQVKALRRLAKLLQRVILTVAMAAQCFLILYYTLSGINGSLVGFYVCVLIGSLFESLLCTYNIRNGPASQIFAFVIFIFL